VSLESRLQWLSTANNKDWTQRFYCAALMFTEAVHPINTRYPRLLQSVCLQAKRALCVISSSSQTIGDERIIAAEHEINKINFSVFFLQTK
jgi:hypothetical protein